MDGWQVRQVAIVAARGVFLSPSLLPPLPHFSPSNPSSARPALLFGNNIIHPVTQSLLLTPGASITDCSY